MAATAAVNAIIVVYVHLAPKQSLAALRQTEQEYTSGGRWFQQRDQATQRRRMRR